MSCIAFLGGLGEFLASSQVQILYWTLAISGTIIFGAFMALTLIGIGGLHDSDAGPDGVVTEHADTGYADFKLISIRSVLAFMTFFGWGGIILGKYGWPGFLGAFASGFSMMFVTAGIMCVIFRLQHSGNVTPEEYIGRHGTVYIGMPEGRAGAGKVTVTIGGSTNEIAAVSDEALATGATVIVVERLDERKFLVKKA